MKTVSRDHFLDRLQQQWQPFVTHFTSLTEAEQKEYLAKQGYASLAALLAHIVAWWQDGAETIAKMQADPSLPPGDYDVDAFNARAVQRFQGWPESAVIQTYETQCQAMLGLVQRLPDAELYHQHINARLYYEIIMHWKEHELS